LRLRVFALKILKRCKMKRFISIAIFAAVLSFIFFLADHARSGTNTSTIYDPDPKHLWNRLNETLFARSSPGTPVGRTYGLDEPDILYWNGTSHLLIEPSHQQALAVLDEFINTHGEKLIRDPLKRALLQRDLWELFDWTALPGLRDPTGRKELQRRLAVVIRRLALTTNEIASLPDNYLDAERNFSLPDLPHGLFDTNGDWVNLAADLWENEIEIAPAHDHGFGGCSPFLVFMRTPRGRAAATNYLYQLDTFQRVWVYETNQFPGPYFHQYLDFSRDLPQFPAGTEFALVRRMCVIDADGRIVPTPIVVSIQKRHYLAIAGPTITEEPNNRLRYSYPMNFYEFRMQRDRNAALRAVTRDEEDFRQFDSMGYDAFDSSNPYERGASNAPPVDPSSSQYTVLRDCTTCHQAAGIYSVNSYVRLFSPRYSDPPKLFPADPNRSIRAAINWKERQFSWGLLQGLWQQAD
jgi:hypothetical protein